ncbi:hypothetical protein GPJ56_009961 [Histomonas meleagridis]|uniref:uncharacterized protein n=1 Tax=Histomonas meleagridis TaxID=135588 RepID=UPI00355A73D8|nr:hypothetical protein GPJ56_009961 [Histomonas meleagridis]KAH0802732.1 hypothetical protein GO595_004239 [Histomonas meleagridis]
MTQLPPKSSKKTASGLSPETDAYLSKLMRKNGMSKRKQNDLLGQIQTEGVLPMQPKPKIYKPVTKPKPEQKVFTMAQVGKRPLTKKESTIIEETNFYEPARPPAVPIGPSSEERKTELATKMWGVDEEAIKQKQKKENSQTSYSKFTMDDQILEEIKDRTNWLEEMHEIGVHEHDAETLRQIDQRVEELKKRRKAKKTIYDDSD